jgi:bifunctional ADP-heptose synthase (sugar kinase/adenylyltransferase)
VAEVFLDVDHEGAGVRALLDAIRPLRCLVIGEAIRDVYRFVTPLGMSPKDAIVTWRTDREETYQGGSEACANHLRQFCEHVGEITQDEVIFKMRYVWAPFVQKVFAVESLPAHQGGQRALASRADLGHYDIVLVADYGHGFLQPDHVRHITKTVPFLALMVQTNSANYGYNPVTKYPRADYICVDEVELRLAMQDREGPIPTLADKLRERMDAKVLAVTLGHKGSLVVDALGQTLTPVITHGRGRRLLSIPLPAVVDRTGAGDAFFSITAPCVAAGATREQIGRMGNAAGAVAVRTMGNQAPVTRAELEALL